MAVMARAVGIPAAGRGRLPEAGRRSATRPGSTPPGTCTPGPSCTSRAPAGCGSSRRPPAGPAASRLHHRARRHDQRARAARASPSAERPAARAAARAPARSRRTRPPTRTPTRTRPGSRGCRSAAGPPAWLLVVGLPPAPPDRAPPAVARAGSAPDPRRPGPSCATPRSTCGVPVARRTGHRARPATGWSTTSARRWTGTPPNARGTAPDVAPEAVTALDRIVLALERLRYARDRRAGRRRLRCAAELETVRRLAARRRHPRVRGAGRQWWPRSVLSRRRVCPRAPSAAPITVRHGGVVDHVG